VFGVLRDARTGEALPLAQLRLDGKAAGHGDGQGQFLLRGLPTGSHALEATHLGYQPWRSQVRISSADTLHLELRLLPADLLLQDLTVQATPSHGDFHDPVVDMGASQLAQRLEGTLAATLKSRPGIEERGMGPATGRPVLRGLSGSRLLVTEDGAGMGDLSAGSADHAVAADPLAAGALRVLRGPEALLEGSNAVGGVVEMERGLLPREGVEALEGSASLMGESASQGRGGALQVALPLAGLDWRVDGTWRAAGDAGTPLGTLHNTGLASSGAGLGLGASLGHLRLGAGLDHYLNHYGIPGGFVGAHPKGVGILMERAGATLQADWSFHREEDSGARGRRLSWRSRLTRYRHEEREAGGTLGLAFDLDSHEGQAEWVLDAHGPFMEGKLRLQQLWRRVATRGLSHMPTVSESGLGLAWMEHAVLPVGNGSLHTTGALRGDARVVEPAEERWSAVVGHIRNRRFTGLSGALSAQWRARESAAMRPSITMQQGWRAPSPEELFSGGPHLAAYAFEIGNPELEPEASTSLELALDLDKTPWRARCALYHTRFSGFIFPSFTGRFSDRRADLYEYRYLGRDAQLQGVELEGAWSRDLWIMELGGSVMRGWLEEGTPLPAMPPAKARLRLSRQARWTPEVVIEAAAAQRRVYVAEDPGAQSEWPTAGWARLDLGLSWQGSGPHFLQQLSLRLGNVLDTEYREHLNRVRVVMPEQGRSLKVMWRAWF